MMQAEAVVPSSDWFPQRYTGTLDDIDEMFARVCELVEIEPERFELAIHESDPAEPEDLGRYYGPKPGGKETISILQSEAGDPMSLVATIAHELAHAMLLGEGRITKNVRDHEWVTDLTTVFLGLGVFGGNSVMREHSQTHGTAYDWRLVQRGYMSELLYAYALAVFAWTRGEAKPAWARHLRPNVRSPMQESLRYLAKTGDSLFGPHGFPAVGTEHGSKGTDELLADMRSKSGSTRIAAVLEVQRREVAATDVVEPLTELLQDSDITVCEEVGYLLGSYAEQASSATQALLGLASNRDPYRRIVATRTLGQMACSADEVVPELALILEDWDLPVRDEAALAVAEFGDEAASVVPHFSRQLEGLHNERIRAPIQALEKLGPVAYSAVPQLIRVIDDGEGESREAATAALGAIGEKTEPVIRSLCRAAEDDDPLVRNTALDVLGRMNLHEPHTRQIFRTALDHDDAETRIWAALALSRMEGQAEVAVACLGATMIPLLEASSEEDVDVHFDLLPTLTFALEEISPAAVQPLTAMLHAKDPRQRSFAAWGLGRMGRSAETAADPLLRALSFPDANVQLFSCTALWNVARKADEVVATLVQLLGKCDLSVPFDEAFHFCEVGKAAAGSSSVYLERVATLPDLYRATIHVAMREIGEPAIGVLMGLLPQADDREKAEIASLLAALHHGLRNDRSQWESKPATETAGAKSWQAMQDQLAENSRRFALATMDATHAFQPASQAEGDGGIHEAEWLLIYGIADRGQASG